ncbi:hypothetical protein PG996_010113 [Apiospora saccharicola]|uniref:Uncharacterized protein n=1 Tax=Apiospora saccharicola TaxID=335842 RepID=A0ABR1UQQ2_9PEZI
MANYVVYPIAFDNAGGAAGPGSAFYSAAMSQARGDIGPSDDGYDDGYDGGDVGWFRGLLRLRSGTDSTCNCRALDRNALIANIFIALFAWVVFVVVVAGLAALVDSRLRRRTRERGRPPVAPHPNDNPGIELERRGQPPGPGEPVLPPPAAQPGRSQG